MIHPHPERFRFLCRGADLSVFLSGFTSGAGFLFLHAPCLESRGFKDDDWLLGYFAMEGLTRSVKPAVVGFAECAKPTVVVVSDDSDDNEDAFGV